MEVQKKILLHRADFVCSISYQLKKIYNRYSRTSIHIVPQGFNMLKIKTGQYKIKLSSTSLPIIGFVGSINERFDMKLLLTICRKNPQWHFVFIGPIENEPHVSPHNFSDTINELFDLPNVTHISRQLREIVYSYIRQFDICMIPYDSTQDFNRYCYPMKLFEYFYIGKPVISTPIEELKRFPKFVKIGRTAEEWEKYIQTLLGKPWPDIYQKEERALAIENSWEKKISTIVMNIP